MNEELINDNCDRNQESDMSMSQSSGIDMQYETVSSQGGSQEGIEKPLGFKSTEVLQKALNGLKDKFPDFQIPSSESDWTLLYENTLYRSKKHVISYEEFLWLWLHLIINAVQSKNNEALLNCYCSAVSLLPIKIFESDTTWVALINGIYSQIIAGDVSEASASVVLETAEKKFKYSPVHAKHYWNAVLKNERQIMKKSLRPLPEAHQKIVNLMKIRFSNPYLSMEDDYNDFSRWSLDINLDKDLRFEVQQTFLEHSKLRNMSIVTRLREDYLAQRKDWSHHLFFENWVDELCNEENANYNNIEVVCEELIASEPESFCYYWVFLNSLAMNKFENIPKRDEKICDVILRGYRLGKTSCKGMDQRFLESSLVIASKTLCAGKVIELIEASLTDFTITNDITKWYASSRGIIIAVSNLICKASLEDGSFKKYFDRIITPCTMDVFKYGSVPQELTNKLTEFETQYLELLRLWVQTQVSYYSLAWEDTLKMWTDIFMNNQNPILLVGYVDFVKSQGKPKEVFEATSFALEQIANLESSQEAIQITTLRCHIKLLLDHLEVLSVSGDIEKQAETFKIVQNKLNWYTNQYPHDVDDLISPQLRIKGFNPYGSVVNQNSSDTDEHNHDLVMNCDANSDNSIVNQLKSLRVGPGSSQSELENNEDALKVAKVFVSNLSYHATEEDLLNAFKDKGFYPINVEIMKSPEGKSRGMAHVTFETKEVAHLAVQLCDKFNVCGRVTFVSQFKSGHKFSQKKVPQNQPTLLNITNIPNIYKDKEVISKKLARFGHVKNVQIQEQDDSSFSARIEFHMKEDAQNAYDQITERKLFGADVICRMGYASSKRQGDEKKIGNEKRSKKKQSKKPKIPDQNEMEVIQEVGLETSQLSSVETTTENQIGPQIPLDQIGPQMPMDRIGPQMPNTDREKENPKPRPKPKPTKGFSMVPTQALKQDIPRVTKRTHMKAKLDIGGSISASSSGASQDSPEKKIPRLSGVETISFIASTDDPANGDKTGAPQLEFASNSNMNEENAHLHAESSLTNKDFQKMFRKN